MVTRNNKNEPTAALGKVLQGQGIGVAPNFSTAAFPSTAGTSGFVITSDGTDFVSSAPPTSADDVTSTAIISDNAMVRGDGGSKGVQTSVPTISDTGSISVATAVSGAPLSFTVSNTSNAGSETSLVESTVAGGTAFDAYYVFRILSVSNWSLGCDNSDSDAFVVSPNTTLGTTNNMRALPSGEITHPRQSCFLAFNASGNNVTGDGTVYKPNFNNTFYDQGGDFNGTTNTFTSPVTGRYLFFNKIALTTIGSALFTSGEVDLVTSNRTYIAQQVYVGIVRSSGNQFAFNFLQYADMDAGDTAIINVIVSGSTKTITVAGTTYFGGWLSC